MYILIKRNVFHHFTYTYMGQWHRKISPNRIWFIALSFFLSLSFSIFGMILYVIGTHNALEILVLMMIYPGNRDYKRNNITNTSDKRGEYRTAKNSDLIFFMEASSSKWKYEIAIVKWFPPELKYTIILSYLDYVEITYAEQDPGGWYLKVATHSIVHLHFYQHNCYVIVALLNNLDLATRSDSPISYEVHAWCTYVHFQRLSFRRAYFDSWLISINLSYSLETPLPTHDLLRILRSTFHSTWHIHKIQSFKF